MTIGPDTCSAIANVLVVLLLALVVDRRAIVRTAGRFSPAAYMVVCGFGVSLGVQGADDGSQGLAGILLFGCFGFGLAGAAGILMSPLWTDAER